MNHTIYLNEFNVFITMSALFQTLVNYSNLNENNNISEIPLDKQSLLIHDNFLMIYAQLSDDLQDKLIGMVDLSIENIIMQQPGTNLDMVKILQRRMKKI